MWQHTNDTTRGDATMNLYERVVATVGSTKAFAWFGKRVLTPLDLWLRRSRFAPARFGTSLPLCFVTTTGRKSGEPRTVPLLFIDQDGGDGIVVVATNFGGQHDPAWAQNLETNPEAVVERDGIQTAGVARRATDEEFGRYWERFNEAWPNYDVYRARTDRELKMFVIE
jgi:deazaflavin-dependent oxidoreductase (nitroreductase family)